jgi:hypothetical protein
MRSTLMMKKQKKATMAVSPQVARTLRKAVAAILEEPRRYDQDEMLLHLGPDNDNHMGTFSYTAVGRSRLPACGTRGLPGRLGHGPSRRTQEGAAAESGKLCHCEVGINGETGSELIRQRGKLAGQISPCLL